MVNGRKKTILYIFAFMLTLLLLNFQPLIAYADSDGNGYLGDVIEEDLRQKSKVHLGGFQVGFLLDVKGVVVAGFNEVDTAVGHAKLKSELACGDVVKYVNGREVESANDITVALDNQIEPTTLIVFSRSGKNHICYVEPLVERVSGAFRLGLCVREEIGGIGTVTYVTQDGRFGALGHSGNGKLVSSDVEGGTVYRCKINGVEKGRKGHAGSISGSIDKSEKIGVIEKSNEFGIYGKLSKWQGELIETCRKDNVKTGDATIKCAISGEEKEYGINVIKTVYQPSDDEKGMVIKVEDKNLISFTGGIVQGMSGSPIVKDGKLIGAVTHVFISDPTRGYGIYIDTMLSQTAS